MSSYRGGDANWRPAYGAQGEYQSEQQQQQQHFNNATYGASSLSSSAAPYGSRGGEDSSYYSDRGHSSRRPYYNRSAESRNREYDRQATEIQPHTAWGRDQAYLPRSRAAMPPRSPDRISGSDSNRRGSAIGVRAEAAKWDEGRVERTGGLNSTASAHSWPTRSVSPPLRDSSSRWNERNGPHPARTNGDDRTRGASGEAIHPPWDRTSGTSDHAIREQHGTDTPNFEQGGVRSASRQPSLIAFTAPKDPRRKPVGDAGDAGPLEVAEIGRSRGNSATEGLQPMEVDNIQIREQQVPAESSRTLQPQRPGHKAQQIDEVRSTLATLRQLADTEAVDRPTRPDVHRLIEGYLAAIQRQSECNFAVEAAHSKLQECLDWVSDHPEASEYWPKAELEARIRAAADAKKEADNEASRRLEKIHSELILFAEDSSTAAFKAAKRHVAAKIVAVIEEREAKSSLPRTSRAASNETVPSAAGDAEAYGGSMAPGPVLQTNPSVAPHLQQAGEYGIDPKYDALQKQIDEIQEVCHATEANLEEIVTESVRTALEDIGRRRRQKHKGKTNPAVDRVHAAAAEAGLALVQRSVPRSQSAGADEFTTVDSRMTAFSSELEVKIRSDVEATIRHELEHLHNRLLAAFSTVQEHFKQHKAARESDRTESVSRHESQQREIEQLKVQVQQGFEERRWLKGEVDALKVQVREAQQFLLNVLQPMTQTSRVPQNSVQQPAHAPASASAEMALPPRHSHQHRTPTLQAPDTQRSSSSSTRGQSSPSAAHNPSSASLTSHLVSSSAGIDGSPDLNDLISNLSRAIIATLAPGMGSQELVEHIRAQAFFRTQEVQAMMPIEQREQWGDLATHLDRRVWAELARRGTAVAAADHQNARTSTPSLGTEAAQSSAANGSASQHRSERSASQSTASQQQLQSRPQPQTQQPPFSPQDQMQQSPPQLQQYQQQPLPSGLLQYYQQQHSVSVPQGHQNLHQQHHMQPQQRLPPALAESACDQRSALPCADTTGEEQKPPMTSQRGPDSLRGKSENPLQTQHQAQSQSSLAQTITGGGGGGGDDATAQRLHSDRENSSAATGSIEIDGASTVQLQSLVRDPREREAEGEGGEITASGSNELAV